MGCIKCGKAVTNNAEFCDECLADMERHPVKPGTPVILPKRDELPATKHSRKKTVKPEVLVTQQRKAIRWLLLITTILLVIATAAIVLAIQLLEGSATPLLP